MLKPLRPDADDDSTNLSRARPVGADRVGVELGNVGGPRIQRVNEYFTRLLGVTRFDSPSSRRRNSWTWSDPASVEGALGQLRTVSA